MGNFSRQVRKTFYTQHCIFSCGYLPIKVASKTVITVVIQFRTLLPISAPFRLSPPPPFECVFVNECPHSAKRPYSNIILGYGYVSTEVQLPLIAHKRAVMPHYKNSGLLSMWVHKFFKWIISSSNFAAIARLVVLVRKDPRTISLFSSLLDLHFVLTVSAHAQQVCYQLKGKSLTLTAHSPSVKYLLLFQFLLLFILK